MKASIKDFEIMAPVGSRESLAAAIQAGADSIYFGIESLNMRARSASTFTVNDLREIAQICDKHGIKSYLTINTIIYDEDIALMRMPQRTVESHLYLALRFLKGHMSRNDYYMLCAVFLSHGTYA